MVFAAPWVLLALPALPLLWWLLRVTPPVPRQERFPAIRLLLDLRSDAETPAHTPLWLLALRMVAAGLVILGLARPVLDAGQSLAGAGDLLLVIDDGWSTAGTWSMRMEAAERSLTRAERVGAKVMLLTTAAGFDGAAPVSTAAMPAAELRPRLAALRPKPWPARPTPALLAGLHPGSVVYVASGIDTLPAFQTTLAALGPVEELRDPAAPLLLLPPRSEADRLVLRLVSPPRDQPRDCVVLAQSGDGSSLARVVIRLAHGEDHAEAALRLPPELRNRLTRLVIEGQSGAGAMVLLDERWRRRPVGLMAGSVLNTDSPLTGPLFYVRRALAPFAELRDGALGALLGRELSVLVLADRVLEPDEVTELGAWIEKGGTLIRFAGPSLAEHADGLLPFVRAGGAAERRMGGAMSWTQPPGLAAFEADTPFAGLAVPEEVHVTRQMLATPPVTRADPHPVWARLADGTPLVTQAARGAGRIVLFHVTANADWSDLPLSGLFVDMMRRLVEQSAGVASVSEGELAPVATMDGFGTLGAPNAGAGAVAAGAIGGELASSRHPPGVYGPEAGRRVLNLGGGIARVSEAPPVPGAMEGAIGGTGAEKPLAPWLIAMALGLLAVDLLLSLRLRGLWLRPALILMAFAGPAFADEPNPALVTRLGYVVSGDASIDSVSRLGLAGLSEYVNRRTNAALGPPAAVVPGRDDLSFYPLLYWPVPPGAAAQPAAWLATVNDYMAHGGIVLIDTRNGGSGEGFAEGADAALLRASAGLVVPPLAPLAPSHVLARAFYLLSDYPGRYAGDPVWVQRDQDRTNDSVSPVIIGGHDWASAWAVDEQGRFPFATIPGGARQRTLAYRFGVNLVMYALTGNYKGDQVHIPAMLERLGQ
jgi:hypothetical protein